MASSFAFKMESDSLSCRADDSPVLDADPAVPAYARAYQIEMFELSLQENVIVAMDTGSGKTQIARLRIEFELVRTPQKRVWFLAPSVVLAQQQYTSLSHQLPAHHFRLITGLDNVQYWSTKQIWDAALDNINVIVSTPQVLLDALQHVFVFLQDLSLLVFDEAHHCTANAPMAKIMRYYYHPARQTRGLQDLPHILGLTASPIMNKASTIKELEDNLNAVCKTPTRQMEEYRRHVHVPELDMIVYRPKSHDLSIVVKALKSTVDGLKLEHDPKVKWLQATGGLQAKAKLDKIYRVGYTATIKSMRSFLGNAEDVEVSLGEWAAKTYIHSCISKLQSAADTRKSVIMEMFEDELQYMNQKVARLFADGHCTVQPIPSDDRVAPKAQAVIDYLVQNYRVGMSAIIFVKRRSTAFALTRLLTVHPRTSKLGIFAFVGHAKAVGRDLGDLADMQMQSEEFADFRTGSRNVCVATSVMEEGVDVQAISLVIRFDEPDTFRAFVQSRGRARQPDSRIAMVYAEGVDASKINDWAALELAMKELYSADRRLIAEREAIEDEYETCDEQYRVSSTGALLTYDDARSHLQHFCKSLPRTETGQPPEEIIIITGEIGVNVRAQIRLPSSMAPSLQVTNSLRAWRSEKSAVKDAAFQCYRRLHSAGVVNDHLLPFPRSKPISTETQGRDSTYRVREAVNPWSLQVDGSSPPAKLWTHRLTIGNAQIVFPALLILLPVPLDHVLSFPLLSTPFGKLEVTVALVDEIDKEFQSAALEITAHLFSIILGRRLKHVNLKAELPYLLMPETATDDPRGWVNKIMAPPSHLTALVFNEGLQNQTFLLRHKGEEILYLWQPDFRDGSVCHLDNGESVTAQRLSKQMDFLQANDSTQQPDKRLLRAEDCHVEILPAAYGQLMLFMPSISYMIEITLRGQLAVQQSSLQKAGFTDSSFVSMALTASAASMTHNYDRLEFLGDALLKFYATAQVFFDYLLLPESALTSKRKDLVNNTRLQIITKDLGLDVYLTTNRFSSHSWSLTTESTEKNYREVSSKTLADIVESLLGAAHLDKRHCIDGHDLVVSLLSVFLPQTKWQPPREHIKHFRCPTQESVINSSSIAAVEGMLRYRFNNKGLLAEALTKTTLRTDVSSYERLEFLGDAVLDYVVATALYEGYARNSAQMTFQHHSLVNHHLLAFLCMGMCQVSQLKSITSISKQQTTVKSTHKTIGLVDHIAKCPDNTQTLQRERAEATYAAVCDEVNHAMKLGKIIPWTKIRSIDTSKVYSDIVESIIASVFIDSGGNISKCRDILREFGLLNILERIATQPEFESRFSLHILHQLHPHIQIEHKRTGQISKGSKKWWCTISLNDRKICSYVSHVSQAHAENAAADLALEVLAAGEGEQNHSDGSKEIKNA